MDTVAFGGTLERWEMFPKDEPSDVTVVSALINEDANESLERIQPTEDWLLFTVERASASVTALRLRRTPLKAGETVFVVGWRYTDEGRQRVYKGKYVRPEKGSVLIDAKELADNTVPGLSGSPVIDAEGYVVGVMSSKFGKLQRLAPIDYARRVLEQQPSRRPHGGVRNPTGREAKTAPLGTLAATSATSTGEFGASVNLPFEPISNTEMRRVPAPIS